MDLALTRSSKVSNKGTTLNLFFIFASFCKKDTDKISEAEAVSYTHLRAHETN